jgi:DNA-binding MarR family transcriptional regulator
VHRALDPDDNRRVFVFITDSGLELFQRVHSLAVNLNNEFKSNMGAKKMREIKRLLNEVIDGIS